MSSTKTIGDALGLDKPPTEQQIEEQGRNLEVAAEKNGSLLDEIDRLKSERVDPRYVSELENEVADLEDAFVDFYDNIVDFINADAISAEDVLDYITGYVFPDSVATLVAKR